MITQSCVPAAVRFGPFLFEPIVEPTSGAALGHGDATGVEAVGAAPSSPALWAPWFPGLAGVAAAPRLTPTAVPRGLRLPGAPVAATELEVVPPWARDVRQQAPVVPRPLPVVC